jgi:hypothetical protein
MRKNETEIVLCLYLMPATSLMGPQLAPTRNPEARQKRHQFHPAEAETTLPRPPFAQKCSRTVVVPAYSARLANPVKIISSTFHISFGSR